MDRGDDLMRGPVVDPHLGEDLVVPGPLEMPPVALCPECLQVERLRYGLHPDLDGSFAVHEGAVGPTGGGGAHAEARSAGWPGFEGEEIGRASCRGRGEIREAAGAVDTRVSADGRRGAR